MYVCIYICVYIYIYVKYIHVYIVYLSLSIYIYIYVLDVLDLDETIEFEDVFNLEVPKKSYSSKRRFLSLSCFLCITPRERLVSARPHPYSLFSCRCCKGSLQSTDVSCPLLDVTCKNNDHTLLGVCFK